MITYQPLDHESLAAILDQQIAELQRHVNTRLGDRYFNIEVPFESRQFLLRKGTSPEYGARELKRTIHRNLTQPLATKVASGQIEPGARVRVDLAEDKESLIIRTLDQGAVRAPQHPTVLLVDDNRDLLRFLERLMAQAGWRLLTAESAAGGPRGSRAPDSQRRLARLPPAGRQRRRARRPAATESCPESRSS